MILKKFREQSAFATGNFGRIFGDLEVPPLPQASIKLIQLLRNPDVQISEVAQVITSDTGIAARVLKTVNSAYYGLPRSVTSVQHAVSLLGLHQIHSIVLSLAAMETLPTKVPGFDHNHFWADSLQKAVFASNLTTMLELKDPDEAFTGALLQNLAQPILLMEWSRYYLPIVQKAEESGSPIENIEEKELSWTHAQAGAWTARKWGLPDALICCIGLHHLSIEEINAAGLDNTPVISVAVSSRLPEAETACQTLPGFRDDMYQELCSITDHGCSELASSFNLPEPEPLVQEAEDPE